MTNSDLLIAFRIEDVFGNPIEHDTFLDIQFVFNNYTTSLSGIKNLSNKTLSFKDCKLINTSSLKLSKNDILKNDAFCLDLDKNFELGGYFDINWQQFIQIIVKPCFNSTSNNKTNCLAFDKALDYLLNNPVYLNIYTIVYYTMISNFTEPLKLSLHNVYSIIDPFIAKSNQLFYKKANISYDMGILTDMSQNYSVFGLESSFTDSFTIYPPLSNPTSDTFLVRFELYVGKNIQSFVVKYIKIQEIFATVGGILSFISLFFSQIASIFNKHEMDMKIVNHLFDFTNFNDNIILDDIIKDHNSKIELSEIISKQRSHVIIDNNLSIRRDIVLKKEELRYLII